MGSKKTTARMDDETYNDFVNLVPDLRTRYNNIIKMYRQEIDLEVPKGSRTPWRMLVLNEIPMGFATGDWLSLVTNYQLRERKSKKSQGTTPKVTSRKSKLSKLLRDSVVQLSFF